MDSETPPVKETLLIMIKSLLKVNVGEEIFKYKEFMEFLQSERVFYLKIAYTPSNNKLFLINNLNMKTVNERDISLSFYKTKKSQVSFYTFFEEVNITYTQNPYAKLICQEIDANILLQLQNKKNQSSLESYIENFKERLENIEKKITEDKIMASQITEDNFELVCSPDEEIDFWQTCSKANPSDIRINMINELFSKIEKYFVPSYEILPEKSNEIFTQIIGCCEDIIQKIVPKFSIERLKHFISLSLDYFAYQFSKTLNAFKKDNSQQAFIKLIEIQKGFMFAQNRIMTLNNLYFKPPLQLSSSYFEKFTLKISELVDIKALLLEISRMMPEIIQNNSAQLSKDENRNEDLLKILDSNLQNVSGDIIAKFNKDIFDTNNHVIMILRDLHNWKGVLSRGNFRTLTEEKRNGLLIKLSEYIDQFKQIYNSKMKGNLMDEDDMEDQNQDKNIIGISQKISQVISAHTLMQKCDNALKLSSALMSDLKKYQPFYDNTKDLIDSFKKYIDDTISEWNSSFVNLNQNLPKIGSDLVEIDKATGFLKVNFSEQLFLLIQDCRLLTEYGYVNKIAKDLIKVNEEGKKIYKEAVSLKQIANFYNTLSSQVIPSQKPMLVKYAKEFEVNLTLVTEKFKRNQTLDLENYVNIIQSAANTLTLEIRKLKKAHSIILDLLCQLLNYDLLSTRNQWKKILESARNVYLEIADGYKGEEHLLFEWKKHWNYQLYKILKIQYTLSLEKFYQFVDEVNCEFSIQHRQLALNPSLEDLKKIIYMQIKTFISIPSTINHFIQDETQPSYYHTIINDNASMINLLYDKLNDSILKIEEMRSNLSQLVGLSFMDFEGYILDHFTKIDDWKDNYDKLRVKRREIEKMDDNIKIDCFKINLISYKLFIDDTFDKVFYSLSSTLKEHLSKTIRQIDDFVQDSMEKMSQKAQSLQEILQFKKNFAELTKKKFEFKNQCNECIKMNNLLLSLTGNNLDLSTLESHWKNFDSMLGSFSEMLEEQKQSLRVDLGVKVNDIMIQLDKFYSKWNATILPDNYMPDKDTDIKAIGNSIQEVYKNWEELENRVVDIVTECKNFDLEFPGDLTNYNKIKSEVDDNKKKWNLFFDFNANLDSLNKEEWLSIRHKAFALLQDLTMNWQDKMKKEQKNFIYFHIHGQIEFFKQSLSVYKYLIGDNFERDHWKSLFNMLKFDNKITKENLIFGNFIDKTDMLIQKQNDIKDLYQRAQGEILIRNAMSELAAWFETAEFQFTENVNHVTNRKTPLIKEWKELMNDISEKQALLLSVKTSEYFSRFEDQIGQYETKFGNLDQWLSDLNLIQRKWVYLEPIFSRGALPKEQSRFRKIDDEFRNILLTLNTSLLVNTIFAIVGIKNTLDMLIDQLEKCQKALNDFLEDKRNKFARLYFIGDDDLLEFLAKSKDQGVIKNNLRKLYQGITSLNISDELTITDINSAIDERVKLSKEVPIVDELEKWLNELTNEMRKTLNIHLVQAMKKGGNQGDFAYLDVYSSQICNLIEMILFNGVVEEAIKSSSLNQLQSQTQKLIQALTVIQAKSGSDNIKLFKIKNLMLDLIHNREVVDKLIETNTKEVIEWSWYSQLKYSLKGNRLAVEMCDGNFEYTFEYQGSCQKLVHTPLTDKCYLTLTQALRLGYGGNPYGPAGTGKTESVKALGQAFGRQVLVFNCDEGIDFKAMGRIFIGLVKSGAWGCFDEFNRLLEEQLSAISIQIQIIQFALKNKLNEIDILNQKVNVDFNSAIYVTMNPACKGYGGRSKLPDNLKILFRPVAMSVPDNLQIAQTLLYAEGFKNGNILAQKVTTLFTLCRQGLSNQQHYDWGLRALKTILTVASQQIQLYLNQGKVASYEEEMEILIKAIRINVLSKLTFDDASIFNLLIRDVFPNVEMNDIIYEDLNKALMESYQSLNYEFIDSQFKKVVQFYEACRQRMGVVIVGPSGCGKSAIWKLLKESFGKLNQKISIHIINPKAMSRRLLLGHMNHDTGEYTYGVLTKCAREVEKESTDVKCWIICDGDVDPEWIEALNSVLDDNRLLTMQNGERINFGSNVNFIFETDSLKFASPATVSRMGIIYMNQEDLDIKSITSSWVSKKFKSKEGESNQGDVIKSWFDNYFIEAYNLFKSGYEPMLSTTNYGSIYNFLSLIQISQNGTLSKAGFADALIKGLGSILSIENRKKFAMAMYQLVGEKPPSLSNILATAYDSKSQSINELKNEQNEIDTSKFSNGQYPLVKTSSVLRDLLIINQWFEKNDPFIVVGPEGCGKSQLINYTISTLRSCQISTINCTSQTTAPNIIQKLMQSCAMSNTSKGKCLRPRDCQKLILYLKDINLPKPDKYNTIQLISFLQQIVAYQGFFDDNLEFVYLERIQIIASMNPSSTIGRFEITTRFTGNVRILFIDYPSNEDMQLIYNEYLNAILALDTLGKFTDLCKPLANSSIGLYHSVKSKYTFDEYPHYIFTPRDVSNWLISLMRYECKTNVELLQSWAYEAMRVFKDKLVGNEAKTHFDKLLQVEVSKYSQTLNAKIDITGINSVLYTSLTNASGNMTIIEPDDYKQVLTKGQMIYERDNDDIHMNYFNETLTSCKIIDRLITKESSNLLLIGTYAVGRKKAVRITSSARNYDTFTLSLTKDYSFKDFKKNIKDLFNMCAIENRVTVFILEIHHIGEFMEYINSLLCSGEVPSMFNHDEQEGFLSQLVNEYKEQSDYKTQYDFFVSKIKKNLKICICLDSDDKNFNSIILNNPALVTRCNVVWFNEASKETLLQLATDELQESFSLLCSNKTIEEADIQNLLASLLDIYQTVKEEKVISTQGKFIQFIFTFKQLVKNKLSNSSSAKEHLQSGLNKLEEAEKFVGELTEKSRLGKIEIENKQVEAKQSLTQITEAMTLSNSKKEQLNVLNAEMNKDKAKIEEHKAEVEDKLKDVMPEVEKAMSMVKKIDSGALAEITVYFRKPLLPQEVYYILKAMLQLIGYNDLSEMDIKSTFNMKAILALQNFNMANLKIENADKIKKYVSQNPNCFNKQSVERINSNLAQISEFIKAVLKFYEVKLKIGPLERDLEQAQTNLQKSQKIMNANMKEIADIEVSIKGYEEKYAKLTGEAEVLKIELNKNETILTKAKSLLSKLTGEKNRWANQINELKITNEMIPYNSLLSGAFITFLGYYNEFIREKIIRKSINCLRFPKSKQNNTVSLTQFLLNESEMLKLKFMGLPTDALSMENAVIIEQSKNTVLIIDPVSKATDWFKKSIINKAPSFDAISLHDSKLLTNIELAIRFGKTLLITDVDKIEPFLVPLLRNEKSKRGPTSVMKIGEKVIDIHEKFRLYLATRDSSIEIGNNALSALSVVNFTVTRSGLESILLGLTIDIEQPELEKQKNELLEEQDKIKLQLSEVEKKLLEELIHLEGNLLENKQLIDSLEASKEKSMQSENILKKSLEQSNEIDHKRNIYKSLSITSTTIYILLQDLSKINPMYQFSLDNFMSLFKDTIKQESQGKFDTIDMKLRQYSTVLIRTSFIYYSRSLFKSDLLVFGLYYIKTVHESQNDKTHWDFLLGNVDTSSSKGSNLPKWIPEDRRNIYASFTNLFPQLSEGLDENWFASSTPEEDFQNKRLRPIDKVVIIQVCRPDRLESAMRIYICQTLKISSLAPPSISMSQLLSDNKDNKIPIMYLTTLGSDPSKELEEFAVKSIGRENYIEIPLGAGDNDKLLTILKESSEKGKWLCLKNIHLAINWLPTLEKEIKSIQDPDQNFRLFLTSETHPKFSPILLQSCIKLTYETPPGIKKNMERIYQTWSSDLLSSVNSTETKQALFALAFIHAILQERRTYIPQGWSKFYEFSYSDLKVSTETLVEYLKQGNSKAIWDNVKGLIKNTFYGGRIDNDFDHLVMCTYIDNILNQSVLGAKGQKILKEIPVICSNNTNDYLDLINRLPENDDPAMFGLPLNVDRSVQRYISIQVLMKLNSIYSLNSDSMKFDKAKWGEKLMPLLSMWKSIYNQDAMDTIKSQSQKIKSKDPVSIYIKSEAGQIYELGSIVQRSLNDISQALIGNGIITSMIMNNSTSLLKSTIPEDWSNIWDGPEIPSNYLKALGKKINGVMTYIKQAANDSVLENCNINLAEFLYPEAFINSLRQKSARQMKVPIDELQIICRFDDQSSGGVFAKVNGLFLQGADFDGRKLVDISGNKSEIIPMPVTNFIWVKEGKQKTSSKEIDIPLYENLFREHFICKLGLQFEGQIESVILKGIALCLD